MVAAPGKDGSTRQGRLHHQGEQQHAAQLRHHACWACTCFEVSCVEEVRALPAALESEVAEAKDLVLEGQLNELRLVSLQDAL